MKTKHILAIAILATILLSTLYIIPLPMTKANSSDPLFSVTLLASSDTNPNRRQWTQIVANSYRSVGIDAQVQYLLWDICYGRVFTPPVDIQKKTFAQGGWDIFFFGVTPGNPGAPFLGDFQYFYSTNTPPGSNSYWYNSSIADHYLGLALTNGYTPTGAEAFKNWQWTVFNDVPSSFIFYQDAVFAASTSVNFNGADWIFDNIGPCPQFLNGTSSFVLGTAGAIDNLIPPISNSWYDTEVFNTLYDSLYFLAPDFSLQPMIASAAPTVTNNGSTFIYPIRQNMTWQDGTAVTSDDVVFSWLAYLAHPASQFSALTAGLLGEDVTFQWLNGTQTRLVIDLNAANSQAVYPAPANLTASDGRKAFITAVDKYTVNVTIAPMAGLGAPCATFHPDGEPTYIIPMHILGNLPFDQWQASAFNTGTGQTTINGVTYTGPVGSGPYKWTSFDATNGVVREDAYTGYWNYSALKAAGLFTINTFYVQYITDKDAAIAALKNNQVTALDQNYQLQADAKAGNLNFATVYLQPGAGCQQVAYNLYNPIFGTGTATPLGQSDPSRAAEAARDVRIALDYLVPRQLIIDTILSGYGVPAGVFVNPISPYFNSNCTARSYDPTAAKSYLAAAGYNTGVAPPSPTVQGNQYLVNEPIVFTGNFTVDPTVSIPQNGIVVRLWMGASNATSTFTPVAQAITTTGGYYQLSYTPTTNGTYYFLVELTGVGALKAAQSGATGPTFQYQNLAKQTTPENSTVVSLNVVSLSDMTSSLQNQINSQNTQISNQSTQISNLNSTLSTANTYGYAAIGIAIVALLVAIVAIFRKR